jgi:hypothetical protein
MSDCTEWSDTKMPNPPQEELLLPPLEDPEPQAPLSQEALEEMSLEELLAFLAELGVHPGQDPETLAFFLPPTGPSQAPNLPNSPDSGVPLQEYRPPSQKTERERRSSLRRQLKR